MRKSTKAEPTTERVLSKISMIQATNPDWKLSRPELPSYEEYTKTRLPKQFQTDALCDLCGHRFAGLVAPCGCGKGTFQIMSSIQDVVSSGYTRPQLIHAPQLHIALSFVKTCSYTVDGVVHEHIVGDSENLAGDTNFESKTAILERWLCSTLLQKRGGRKDQESLRGMIMVCSNALLVAVFDRMEKRTEEGTPNERKKAIRRLHSILKDTTFRPDESHHLKNTSNEELIETNGLSRFYRFLYNSHVKSSKVVFTTATPFRGDCQEIFSKEILDDFRVHTYEWLKHWKTLGIRSFGMNYMEYRKSPVQQILDAVAAEPKRHPLVTVPRRTESYRKGAKGEREVRKLIKGLEKLKPGRVCDLVIRVGMSQAQRDKNKQELLDDNERLLQGEKHKFDIVVACDVVREGTDWVICDRIHESAPKRSITQNIQTMGRMFRKFHGKTTVVYCAYLPMFIIPRGCTSRTELLEDRTRILLFFLVVDNMVFPFELPRMRNEDPGDPGDPDATFSLEDLYKPVPTAFLALTKEITEGFRCSQKPPGVGDLEHAENIIQDALTRYDTPEEHMKRAAAYFLRVIINLFGAKKLKTCNYEELVEILKEMGPVLLKDASGRGHYGIFVGKKLKLFYDICTSRREEFFAQVKLRPSSVE